jgi:hypothetical protein
MPAAIPACQVIFRCLRHFGTLSAASADPQRLSRTTTPEFLCSGLGSVEGDMDDSRDGKTFRIPYSRRLSWDLLWFNQSVPLCGHDRYCNLSALAAARKAADVRISWPAIFLKAYALVAQEVPELRQTWHRWPWAHLYQHPSSVGTLTVQREVKGERWLFWGTVVEPEAMSLIDIQRMVDHFTTGSPRDLFGREQKLARLPTILRRMIWGWNLHVAHRKRATRLGTFFLSTLAGRGVEIQVPPSIHTGCLTYGPIDECGKLKVTLAYDHRVLDGALIAEVLARLEATLSEALRLELLQLRGSASPVGG